MFDECALESWPEMATRGRWNKFMSDVFAYFICGTAFTCPLEDSHSGNKWENQVQGLLRHILHWKVLCCHFTWKQDGTSDGVTPDFPGVIVSGVDSSEGINSLGCIGLWAKISPHFTLEFLQKYFVKIIRIKSEKELTPEIEELEPRFFCTWVPKTRSLRIRIRLLPWVTPTLDGTNRTRAVSVWTSNSNDLTAQPIRH